MHYVVFQGTEKEGKAATSGQYYNTLVPLVNKSPGFLKETGFGGLHKERSSVLVATFEDEDAIKKWRNEPTHLRFQGKASHGIYEDYRIRIGSLLDQAEQEASQVRSKTEQCILLYYRDSFEGTPSDDITSLIDKGTSAKDTSDELMDSAVYQGPKILWISTWNSQAAASEFGKLLHRVADDEIKYILVKRDYGQLNREDAPSEIAGGIQAEHVAQASG